MQWWAAIFRTSSSMFDKMLHLSKSQGSAIRLRSHNFREAISNLSPCTFRMRCPGSIAQACIKLASASTRSLRFTNPRAAALSVHRTIVPGEQLHILLHKFLVATPSQAPPTSATNFGLTRTQANHVLFLTIFDVSSAISIGHHHDRTLRSARNSRNINIATNRRIPNQISQQTLDVDFITSGRCADVS